MCKDAQNQPLRGERLLAHICTTVRLRAVAVAHRLQRLKFLTCACTCVRRSVGRGRDGCDAGRCAAGAACPDSWTTRRVHTVSTQALRVRPEHQGTFSPACTSSAAYRRPEGETPSVVYLPRYLRHAALFAGVLINVPSVTGGPTSSGWGSLVKPTPHPGLRMVETRHPHGGTGIRPVGAAVQVHQAGSHSLITNTVMIGSGEIILFMPREFTPRCEIVLKSRGIIS